MLRPFPSYLATPLMDEGFELTGTGLSADCCVGYFSVTALPPARTGWDGSQLPAVGVSELERRFWPGKFVTGDTPVYVVPIRPKWAESLFGAAVQPELSRRPEHLGVAREHVYYCALRTNLKFPSRLLWYVSGTGFNGGIRATSWLDAVVVDRPRTLHRRFGLNGVYTAPEVESIIKKRGGRATAMVFSRTEVLGRSVPIKELKALDPRFNVLRSTRELDEHVFVEILKRGAT